MTPRPWVERVAWITGASAGLGEALARRLSAQGAQVILSGRRVAELERVASQRAGPSLVLPFEVTDFQALPLQVAEAWAWRGRVDLLVNNAGDSQRSLALDTAFEVYRRLIDLDLLAPIRLTQLALPRMVAAGGVQIAIRSALAGKIGAPPKSIVSAHWGHAASSEWNAHARLTGALAVRALWRRLFEVRLQPLHRAVDLVTKVLRI